LPLPTGVLRFLSLRELGSALLCFCAPRLLRDFDHLAVRSPLEDPELHAAVLFPALPGCVARDRSSRTEAPRRQPLRANAALDEGADHCLRARLREREVQRRPAAIVRVSLDLYPHQLRVRLQDARDLVQEAL